MFGAGRHDPGAPRRSRPKARRTHRPPPPGSPLALRHDISSPAAPLARRWTIAHGRFETLITAWGSGYLRRGDLALTRWSDDPIAGLDGAWLVLRDQTRGLVWGATPLPLRQSGSCVVQAWPTAVVFEREQHGIASRLAVAHAGDSAELRVLTVENRSPEPRALDVTAWTEPVLARWAADAAHPGFSKLFVQTEAHPEAGTLLASRRPRGHDERFPALAAVLAGPGRLTWTTDRARFIGRGHDASDPRALEPGAALSGTAGSVLDPVLALRRAFVLEPGQRASFAFALAAADDREATLALAARAAEPEAARAQVEAACAGEPGERFALPVRPTSSARPRARVESVDGSGDGGDPGAPAAGRFTAGGYEFEVRADALPPRPWVNVLANERFGTLVSERGAACTWDVNSRERRLTPWSNDAVSDPHGEALYLRDDDTLAAIPPQPGPMDDAGAFEVTHGLGFSRWRRAAQGLALETTLWVDRVEPVQCCRVRIREIDGRARRLSLHAYRQLVLGSLAHEPGRRIAVRA
ncbi:MAG TPA: hypothetical protein VFK69_14730, partial [Candidatus Eisenbacteria bacterium]|nr:hypothetical protein [Candidatus Eisenbacteria bacterium]